MKWKMYLQKNKEELQRSAASCLQREITRVVTQRERKSTRLLPEIFDSLSCAYGLCRLA